MKRSAATEEPAWKPPSKKPLLPQVRPAAWVSWYKEHTSLVERKPTDKRHALLVVGRAAADHISHNAFLPTNLNLESASIQYFSNLTFDQIKSTTQLAIFVDVNIEEVARSTKTIERILLKCALILYCKEGFDIQRPANEATARLGLNDPKMSPFYCITDQDFALPPDWRLIYAPDNSTLPPGVKLVEASAKDVTLYFKMQRILALAAKLNAMR